MGRRWVLFGEHLVLWRFDGEMALLMINLGLTINIQASWGGFQRCTRTGLKDTSNRNTLEGTFYRVETQN